MGYKSGLSLCPEQEMFLYGQAQDWSCMFKLSITSMARWAPGSHLIPAPLSQGTLLKRRAGGAGFVSCKVPTCHTMWSQPQGYAHAGEALALSPSQTIAKSASGRILLLIYFSWVCPCFLPLALPSLSSFCILKTVPIKWLFNQFDHKRTRQKCGTSMKSGISCRTATLWQKNIWIFSWKMISSKTI